MLQQEQSSSLIESVLQRYAQNSEALTDVELLDGLRLAGAMKLVSASKSLIPLLESDSAVREDVVAALGAMGDASVGQNLIDLAQTLYRDGERSSQSISNQPVEEDDNIKARLYWRILQALGNLPSRAAIRYLLAATADYAPDKRQQSLDSLENLFAFLNPEEKRQYEEIINQALDDPSTPVRVSSLRGVAALNAVQHLDKVLKMSSSQEPSISRQALATLGQLSHDKKVLEAIKAKLAQETDVRRKQRLEALLKR
jgi:HEAT repeat protein